MKKIGSLFYKPKKDVKAVKAKRWNIWGILGKAIKRTCMAIGAMVLLSSLISVFLLSRVAKNTAPKLPDDIVLYFNIEDGITETQTRPSLMDPFPFMQPTLRNVIDTLEKARDDSRVRGVIFKLNGAPMSIVHVEELRQVLLSFKKRGKFTKIYATSYADPMGGLSQYYLASSFDEIWMQPVGIVSLSGPSMEMPFAKGALDKLGVQADFFQREEYKSAMENFSNANISSANNEAMTSLLDSLSYKMLDQVSVDRDIPKHIFSTHMNKGILTGTEALEAKIIDRLDYGDVMLSEIREAATGDPDDESVELISLAEYSRDKKKPKKAEAVEDVALIYVTGTIVDSTAGTSGGASEVVSAITQAYLGEDIKAIVVRVDSPGGSPSASETIRRSLVRAKEKGKKVIVSMGPVAASGGYWVSTDADKILASAGTITGSIGVVMGKFEASELFKKLGVNWQGPGFGENADLFAVHKPFDGAARARMNILIDDVYNAFITRVAQGRGLSAEQTRSVAKGRVWTGEQALERGLVDKIGGLNDALDETAVMLGKVDRHDLNVIKMPKELTQVERVLELLGQEVSLGSVGGAWLKNNLGIDLGWLKPYVTQQNLMRSGTHSSVYNAELEGLR